MTTTNNKLHFGRQIISNKKPSSKVVKDTSNGLCSKGINAKPSSGKKKDIISWKKLSIWDKLIIIAFVVIALYELAGMLGPWNYFSTNIVLSLSAIFVFGWDLFYIENINTSEDQKKINNFFEILILSIIISTIIFFKVPVFSFSVKLSAAIDLFKLFIGSILLGLVISTMQESTNFTLVTSLISIFALCTIFVSYSNFSAIDKNLDNANNTPSMQDFRKFIAHSKKSDLKKYNDIINKALKTKKSTSKR